MFDSVLRRAREPGRKVSVRALLSVGAHALALGALIWLSAKGAAATKEAAPEVTFFNPHGKGAPGVPALQQGNPLSNQRVPAEAQPSRKDTFRKSSPNAKRSAAAATTGAAIDPYGGDDAGLGSPDGAKGGDPNAGSSTATAAAPPPPAASSAPEAPKNTVIPFGPGMERPKKLSGPDPAYTRDAREAKVEGKVLAQCVITVGGQLTGCKVLKGLPFMDQAVLSALAQQRWSPATVGGQPVAVLFTIPFSFKLKD